MATGKSFTNAAAATFKSWAGPYGNGRGFTGNLINNGNLIVDVTLAHTNTSSTSSNTGTITIASGNQYTVTGGTYNFNGGTATGKGILFFSNSIANYNVSAFPLIYQTFDGTTISSSATPIQNNNVLQLNASNIVNASITNNDSIIVTSWNNLAHGTFIASAGSLLSSNGQFYHSDLTFDNAFTNHGTLELLSLSGYNSYFHFTAGTLINETDGFLHSGGLYNVTHILQAPSFENKGQMKVEYNLNMDMTVAPKAYYNRSTGTLKAAGSIVHNNILRLSMMDI